ncbi:Uncharacterised protein [Bordetella pertussis]|nr:Uncharacterised protein [Bordetella pertussis]
MPVSSSSSSRELRLSELCSSRRSAASISAWDFTDTYSPAAMDSAPATRPARPEVRMAA